MSVTTEQDAQAMGGLVCEDCKEPVVPEEEEEYTVCRSCNAVYHLECAGVTSVSKKYGCPKCYDIPGNIPRIRKRQQGVPGADNATDGVPAPDDTEVGGQGTSHGNETMVASNSPRRGSVCGSEDSVGSRRSRRDDRLMDAIHQQSQLLAKLVERLDERSERQSTQPQVRRSVDSWAQETAERQQPTTMRRVSIAPPTSRGQRPVETEALHSTRREDRGLDLTRISTTAEFLECLEEAKLGTGGPSHRPVPALPPFEGGDLAWLEFISYYMESTREYGVSDIKNAERLRAALKGEPLAMLNSTMISTRSLGDALDQLRITYGNPSRIIAALEREIVQTECVDEQGRNLQKLLVQTKRFVNYVDACGYDDMMFNRTLLEKLVDKLPLLFGFRWDDFIQNHRGVPSLKLFAEFLQSRLEACLRLGKNNVRMVELKKPARKVVLTTMEVPSQQVPSQQVPLYVAQPAAQQVKPTGPPVQQQGVPSCRVCKGPHGVIECKAFAAAGNGERLRLAEMNRLCFFCLRPHWRRQCRVPGTCNEGGCTQRHHPLLHLGFQKRSAAAVGSAATESNLCVAGQEKSVTLFKVLPVKLRHEGAVVETYCFIDEGSSVSLMDEQLKVELGLEGHVDPLTIKWANARSQTDHGSRRVKLSISGEDGRAYTLDNVRTLRDLQLPEQTLEEAIVRRFFPVGEGPTPHARVRPRILLGLRHAHLGLPRECREDPDSELLATRTKLGWLIYGSGGAPGFVGLNLRVCHASVPKEENADLEDLVKSFYDVDSFGVRAAPHRMGKDDERALVLLKERTRRVNGRYETGLLWKRDEVHLPDSREMCLKRMKNLRQRMAKNSFLERQLEDIISDHMRKEYCVDVTGQLPQSPLWYLPVFPVINPNKPGKVRLVFDAAAKVGEHSLNTHLLTGPDLLNALPEVLMRFREGPVGVSADITEMFHQVRIRREDQDAQRFFWWPVEAETPRELRLQVMTFGATCSPTAAQYVMKENAKGSRSSSAAVTEILCNYYVDDQLSSFPNVTKAIEVMQEVVKTQSEAGFVLQKFRSSHQEVLQSMSAAADSKKEFASTHGTVLGMQWDCATDCLQFSVRNAARLKDEPIMTRRKMLSGTMSLFDPLGLAANVVVKAKILMKDCLGLEWDAEVSEALKVKWRDWCLLLEYLDNVRVPRFLGLAGTTKWELHTFVDASEEAYAAATYVRGRSEGGDVVCSLVMAKTRVAPARATTMPRMELMAAVLGARLADTVKRSLTTTISRSTFWTDSMDCLCWIRSRHRRYHAFVAARVNEILDLTNELCWRWVPTSLNVADDATRLAAPIQFERWFGAPGFLYEEEMNWPVPVQHSWEPKEEIAVVMTVDDARLGLVPDSSRFSQWRRLVNATAYALRVILGRGVKTPRLLTEISPEEARRAVEELWRAAQLAAYPDLYAHLQKDKLYVTPKGHPLHRVCPIMDDRGLLRVNGRLPASLYPAEVRQPVILPTSDRIVRLLVENTHRQFHHMHHSTVVNEIRRNYYMPGLKRLVKKVADECLHCRVRRPEPVLPQEGPLPEARAAIGFRAFTYCGVDYFGPLEVVVGRRREKRWGALFTCLTTRAVHVEIAHSLTMESCMMCFRLLCSRRDVVPVEMRSDRGTNFIATDKELRRFADRFPSTRWVFNPPGAPHMGGAWERMVRTVKRCFLEVVGTRPLTDEILRCALVEVEWVVNQHPLTYVPVEGDVEPALTPNDFLHGARQQRSREESVLLAEPGESLKKTWRTAQQIADHFWLRFAKEVVPVLNLPTRWFRRAVPLEVGDMVMVYDETRRGNWARGRIIETLPGRRDDQVRQVRVQTAAGLVTRPVAKVARICSRVADGVSHGVGDVGS